MQAVGICASDLKCFHGAPMYWGDGPVPPNVDLLATPGHEFVGEIVAIDDLGRQRWGVDTGDRVVAEQIVPCWKCRFCRRGQYWMCAPHNIFGFRRSVNGAMAEYMIYPADAIVHKVSPDIPGRACSVRRTSVLRTARRRARTHRVRRRRRRRRLRPDRTGHDRRRASQEPGPRDRLGSRAGETRPGAECGADITINIGTDDAESVVRDLTEGYGADVYLDATGHPSAVPQGLGLLRKLGRYVEYGVFAAPVTVDWTVISDIKELDVLGAHLGPYCWPTAISMIEAKALPLDRICSHQLPLEEFRAGIDLVGRGSDSVKVSLIPGEGA